MQKLFLTGSLASGKLELGQVLRRVDLRREPGPVRPTGTAALHPKDGVPVTVLAQN